MDKIRLTPYAWAKLHYMCHNRSTEVGSYAICELKDDPLLITDFFVPKQECTSAYTEMDDTSVANFIEDCVDRNLEFGQFDRIWAHTHPPGVNGPSGTDEKTFERVLGAKDWAVMLILPKHGQIYARLRIKTKLGEITKLLTAELDYSTACPACDPTAWEAELKEKVSERTYAAPTSGGVFSGTVVRRAPGGFTDLYADNRTLYGETYGRSTSKSGSFAPFKAPSLTDSLEGMPMTPDVKKGLLEMAQDGMLTQDEVNRLLERKVLKPTDLKGTQYVMTDAELDDIAIANAALFGDQDGR